MNKKTIAIIALSALSSFLAVMLIIQVLAATYINLSLSGIINYNATEIGARLFGVSSISHGGGVLA